ncbi:hypothetical protein [Adhaeribacter radiodurans]|uniref:Uncharacterized protein n=1 Tax=Adhaeribacter radiodurans TaxID=2745197 RepID=A0A7L7L9W9_9BACT|nr:hypothetical protein [Adhaeribacter radiodurans]QMU29335.1 hypothetical protein HUW48_15410 [Adhaeribacter radiodurans]
MLAFAFSVSLASILVVAPPAAASLLDVPGKAQAEKNVVSTDLSYSSNINKKNSLPFISDKAALSRQKPEQPTSDKIGKLLFRVEPITKPSTVKAEDSAYLIVPVLSVQQNKPVVWKLRLIFPDSSGRKARDYRLLLDSPENLLTELLNAGDNSNTYGAYLQAINEQEEEPVTLTNAVKVSTPVTNAPSLPSVTANNHSVWQTLLFWGSGLAGVFCLLWATSRFLVFNVSVKSDNAVSFSPEKKSYSDSTVVSGQVENQRLYEESHQNAANNQLCQAEMPDSEENLLFSVTETQEADAYKAEPNSYFSTEILLTAGPRKKYMSDPDADKDLGEDACVMVANHQQLLLWVLDGTSDQYCLHNPVDRREYFRVDY